MRDSRIVPLAVLDAESVHACSNLITALHLRVLSRQCVEIRAVSAAEISHADGTVGVGTDFEVAAGKKLVRDTHMSFASDHETARRNFELLSVECTADTNQNRPARGLLRSGALRDLVNQFCLFQLYWYSRAWPAPANQFARSHPATSPKTAPRTLRCSCSGERRMPRDVVT